MQNVKLFCFPYAGGSATIYSKWKPHLTGFELVPVELAGRGKRMQDRMYAGLHEAVDDLYQRLRGGIEDSPYAFFGHSLGGLLAYELAQKIKNLDVRQPLHLFFSGKSAPSVERRDEKKYHLMDDEEFKQEVMGLGGTPPEFFNHPELMDLFLPLLRNDFKLAETSLAEKEVVPFDCDISVFLGKEDNEISAGQADGWKAHTKGACTLHYFNGDHFFLHDETAAITALINYNLTKHCQKIQNVHRVTMSF